MSITTYSYIYIRQNYSYIIFDIYGFSQKNVNKEIKISNIHLHSNQKNAFVYIFFDAGDKPLGLDPRQRFCIINSLYIAPFPSLWVILRAWRDNT